MEAMYCSVYCGYARRIITFVWPWYRPWWPRFVSRRQFSTPPLKMLSRTWPSFPIKIMLATAEYIDNEMSMEPSFDVWACREQVHGVLPKKWLHVVCCVLFFEGWKVGAPNLRPEIHRPGQYINYSLLPPTSSNESDEDETNDTNVEAWPQWTNVCEMGRWFDDLIAARTHRRIEC